MTFDEQYPDAEMDCEKRRCGGIVKLLEPPKKCFWCGQLTQWVDLGFEAAMCSAQCNDEACLDASLCGTPGYVSKLRRDISEE